MAVEINFSFREKIGEIIEGNLLSYCYQCGACVGDCPTARFDESFNPRRIMLDALYGLEDRLIGEDSPIWKCSNCYTCYERCPQMVKPVEVIIALKNLMARAGHGPEGNERIVESIKRTGRSVLITGASIRMRNELGLPPLADLPGPKGVKTGKEQLWEKVLSELEEILKP